MINVDQIDRRFQQLRSDRSIFEQQWWEVANVMWPASNVFLQTYITPGLKRSQNLFDSTALLANQRLAAALFSVTMPTTEVWHQLVVKDKRIKDSIRVKQYLEEVNDAIYQARYRGGSMFEPQANEVLLQVGAFGNGCFFISDRPGYGPLYSSIHLSEAYIDTDYYNRVIAFYRYFILTAEAACREYGDRTPAKVKQCLESAPNQQFYFVQAILENKQYDPRIPDYRGMRWLSITYETSTREVCKEAGFRTQPFMFPRYTVAPREKYGRGPGEMLLPEIKSSQQIKKSLLRAGQLGTEAPLLSMADGMLGPLNLSPNAVNPGWLDESGNPKVRPLEMGGKLPYGVEMLQDERQAINDGFLNTLFQILVDSPQMTATEALQRAQEKGALLAPVGARIKAEWLAPLIERELDILEHSDMLPPPPEEMIEADADIDIEYSSPLSRMMKSDQAVGILRTFEAMAPIAQINGPQTYRRFNFDKVSEILAEGNGMPASCLFTESEMQQIKQQQDAQAEMQNLLASAPVAAQAAERLAKANQLQAQAKF